MAINKDPKEMDRDEVRQFIVETMREVSKELFANDKFIFKKNIKIEDGFGIESGMREGLIIGTDTGQKIGFYGTTPVDQPVTVIDPTTEGGVVQDATCRTRVGDLIDRLQELGLIA